MTLDTPRARWIALLVLCLGDLMIVVDVSIVNVALPSIADDLGFSETSLAWVVNAYLLTFGGFLLLGGRLGDLFGQRRLFLLGIALFTAASIVCGLSTSQGMLVGARAVQGLGGAVVSAVALSLIMGLFSDPGERAKALGVFGFCMAGGGSIGVLLGGILTDLLSWHWIFLVNVPIGIAVAILTRRLIPATPGRGTGRIDIAGAVTITGGADARGVRDRERQRQRLALRADARAARGGRGAVRRVRRDRVAGRGAARAVRGRQDPERLGLERRRRPLGGGDVRGVLHGRPLPPAGARATARSRSGSRSCPGT